ncbi:MAG TPA: type II toxin-antitoxin system VapC family toxin, partial [Solirubrobacteraceae bacterium]|nr:type II toxin-antitoxin system VapC family toxin [Solirubrobacteraceae bacterium]
HTVRRFAAQGAISASRARTALGHLAELPIIRVGHLGLLESAWALRARLSFYHALYVALAQRLGTSLLTCDGRLAEAPGLTAPVQRL